MHPPLDRPHPDCQEEIRALQECHATQSKLKFWACNDIKFAMDRCLREEKAKMLKEINKDMYEHRKEEEKAFAEATGQTMSFEEYLRQDKGYQKESQKAGQRDGSGRYQARSTGAHSNA